MKIWLVTMGLTMLGGVVLARGQNGVVQMPNAVAICAEGCTITAIPAGTAYQLGVGTGKNYTPVQRAKGQGGTLLVSYQSFSFDPAPNQVKTFYVQQKAEAYQVTYLPENSKTAVTVSVTALGTAPMAMPVNSPAGASGPAANGASNQTAKQAPAKAAPTPVRTGPPPAPPPTPTTLQVLQYTCAAPVAGTVIPPGLPNGIAVVCVYGLANLPLTTPAATTPAH